MEQINGIVGQVILIILVLAVERKTKKNHISKNMKEVSKKIQTSLMDIQICVENNGGSLKKCVKKKELKNG